MPASQSVQFSLFFFFFFFVACVCFIGFRRTCLSARRQNHSLPKPQRFSVEESYMMSVVFVR